MEIYRTLNGPFPGCPSYGILQRMYEIALPELRDVDGVPVDIAHASLEALHERDSKMFFPQGALEDILDEDTIREVLNCDGKNCCGRAREKNLSNFKVLVTWVFRNARILLAVLIYLGRTSQINTFRERSIGDDDMYKGVSFISKQQPVGSSRAFANFYEKTLDLFKPPIFVMGNPKFTYDDNQRFPYIHDEECGKGSFGKVRRFEIHPDYLDPSLAQIAAKYSPPSALAENSTGPPAVFARKVLKYTLDESEFDMEMQVLRIIDEQRHDNIIDVVAFYSWRGELNCVFPFVELTLYEVLHENWKPESMAAPARFPEHWLWQQMILVADALQTIHNPPKQLRPDLGIVVGFHFDLKPKNILVTPDGILKITDFGQSMVKMVEEKEYAYGTYIGGDFAYGPPEVAPTRNEIKELVLPPSLQSSRQFPDPPTPPSTTSRNNSTAASHRASYDSRKRSSTKSLHSPSGALPESELVRKESFATSVFGPSSTSSEVPKLTATANYDVWSLACIMTEVLAFIFEGGADAVKNFESLRREEGRDLSFHKGIQDQDCLKDCVRRKFHAFRAVDHPDATFKLGQPGSYLSDVVGLLEDMFVADPARRLSSARVVTKLNTIDANHKEDSDPNTDILHVMRNLRPIEGFTELGYLHNDGIVPFYSMAGIKFEIDDHSVVECRLQLFRKAGAVYVRIRYGDRFMNDDSHTFDTNASFFCPMYLFDPLKRHRCCLKDKHHQRTFHFKTNTELMIFQAAILRQDARRGIRVSKVELQPKNRGNETYKDLHDPNTWGRCQVWQQENPQYVPTRSSMGLSSSRRSTGPIHVLFFSPKAVFGIPLQDGKKRARETQDLFRDLPKEVVVEKQGGFAKHFHYIKVDAPGHLSARGEPLCPALPLSSAWLNEDDSKKAYKVDIVFPAHPELLKFKEEVMRANKENHHKANEIPWTDAQRS